LSKPINSLKESTEKAGANLKYDHLSPSFPPLPEREGEGIIKRGSSSPSLSGEGFRERYSDREMGMNSFLLK
jgi:hypothetical protein